MPLKDDLLACLLIENKLERQVSIEPKSPL